MISGKRPFHRQRDTVPLAVDSHHGHHHPLLHLDHFGGSRTNRSASWLMCTSPSWCTPMSTKAPNAVTLVTMPGQSHARLEVVELLDALGELERLELAARVAAGLGQLGQDVAAAWAGPPCSST